MVRTVLALLLALEPLSGAAPPKPRPVLRIPVWTSSNGTLAINQFKATVDGASAKILGLQQPGQDLLVILVMDLVGDLTLADVVKQSLTDSIKALPGHVYVAVMRAQDGLQVLTDPTPDSSVLASTIQGVSVTGTAGLLETVETALELADSITAKSGIRAAVYFVTDSSVSNYREDFTNPVINSSDSRDISRTFPEGLIREKISKMENLVLQRQTPLFILHDAYHSDRLNEAYQSGLLELAVVTGGTAIFCRSSAEIQPSNAKLWAQMTSAYMLSVQLPEKIRHTFEVKIDAGGAAVTYRARFTIKGR